MSASSPLPTASSPERSVVISKAVSRAADLLGLSNAALARTIGVSESTASRLRGGNYPLRPGTKPYELALLLVRLFRSLDAIVGGDEISLRSWMGTTNHALRGVPQELVQTTVGLVAIVDYVDASRSRV